MNITKKIAVVAADIRQYDYFIKRFKYGDININLDLYYVSTIYRIYGHHRSNTMVIFLDGYQHRSDGFEIESYILSHNISHMKVNLDVPEMYLINKLLKLDIPDEIARKIKIGE